VTAIVLGTPGTPYQFGFFEVCAHSHWRWGLWADSQLVQYQFWQGYERRSLGYGLRGVSNGWYYFRLSCHPADCSNYDDQWRTMPFRA
jgi:hypothetical protein